MYQQQLHFAHANGFPAKSYKQIISAFAASTYCFAKPMLAHEESLSFDKNWQTLVDELIVYCEQNKQAHIPLWAVGHSMGAIVSFKACCQRSDLFQGLIMLDPPLITGTMALALKIIKKTTLIDKITPAGITALRKREWTKNEDPLSYFSSKTLFQDFDKQCVQDYITAGLFHEQEVRKLRFQPSIEAQLFRHIPDDLSRYKKKLKCPGHIVVGRNSKVCKASMYRPFVKQHGLTEHQVEGGHMFPLEYPDASLKLIESVMSNAAKRLS